jgi:rhodanese-related sulfurtransferase
VREAPRAEARACSRALEIVIGIAASVPYLIAIAIIVTAIISPTPAGSKPMTRTISRQDLLTRLLSKTPPVVVEALPEGYYIKGHIPRAVHLPHDRVRALAPALLPDRNAAIVAYCASATCQNSHIAADTLRAMGYTDVSVYAEGKQDWTEAGLPLETGAVAAHAA